MYALNLPLSPKKIVFWECADLFKGSAGETGKALQTSDTRPPGVSDSIELYNGLQATRQATNKGSWGNAQGKYPSMCTNVKRGAFRWPRRE